jgi:tRNA(adenine34) deaminase
MLANMGIATHEAAMRLAVEAAKHNLGNPFGSVIVRISNGEVVARGVNERTRNPILHGEIACMNAYVETCGNRDWEDVIIYTTAEPCAMCMSALIWANIGGVVYGSPLSTVAKWAGGHPGITIEAKQVIAASKFLGGLIGGVLQEDCDALFL